MNFDHNKIEKKWQKKWEENKIYKTNINSNKKKYYALDMFPYPSGAGLHVGHPEGYTATDIVSRMKRSKGFEVLHPIGWDAFGLPAEQYAIKTKNSPKDFTKKNIENFKSQLKSLGFSFDWDLEINTTDENYYKHTQWIFAQFYKNGLAEIKEINVNWSPTLNTVLSNEEVLLNKDGIEVGERDGKPIEKRKMKQWVLNITKYAKRLFDGLEDLDWPDSIKKLQKNWIYFQDEKGNYTTKLHLKDWIFARQRYWGEPFPIIHFEDGQTYLISEKEYPIKLPEIKDYSFSQDGLPALSKAKDWINVEINGKKGKRDLNTMPQWAGSCWYYIAYIVKDGDKYLDLDSKEAKKRLNKWLPVDLYVGGQEHAVLHLLYARFWHMFLNDIKILDVKEPFQKLFNQGMILGPDNQKMSKSKGNVINPDKIVKDFGADTLRVYEMFMGALEDDKPWSEKGVISSRNWLEKIYNFFTSKAIYKDEVPLKTQQLFNVLLEKINNYYELLKFNVAISEMMIFMNHLQKETIINKDLAKNFLVILSCIAPHISEEIWSIVSKNETDFISKSSWPEKYNVSSLEQEKNIAIQINGKLRGLINSKEIENLQKEKEIILYLEKKFPKYLLNKKVSKIFIKEKVISLILD